MREDPINGWMPWEQDGVRWRIAPGGAAQVRNLLAAEQVTAEDGGGMALLKRGPVHVVTVAGDLVIKKFQPLPGCWSRLRFVMQRSRTRRACRLALALRAAGVPVVEPLAYGIMLRCRLPQAEYMITRRARDRDSLTVFFAGTPAPDRRENVLLSYGTLLGAFHRNGFYNRDLKDGNVMCARSDPACLQVADLDGVGRCRYMSRFRCARDWRALIRSLAACG